MGSGRTETMRAIFGADPPEAGAVDLRGSREPAHIRTPSDAVRHGIALLTEDRKEQGLFLTLPVRANVSITRLSRLSRLGWIDPPQEQRIAAAVCRFAGHQVLVRRAVGRAAQRRQSAEGRHRQVALPGLRHSDLRRTDAWDRCRGQVRDLPNARRSARKGKAILFVSSDLKELMAVCHRILVMSAGRVAGSFARGQWTQEAIMTAAFSEYVKTPGGSRAYGR